MIFLDGPRLDSDPRSPIITAAAVPRSAIPEVKTLEDYHKRELDMINKAGGKVVEVRDVTIGGMPAKRVVWTARFQNQDQYIISIGGVMHRDAFYGVSFTGTPDQAKRLRSAIELMLASFKVD